MVRWTLPLCVVTVILRGHEPSPAPSLTVPAPSPGPTPTPIRPAQPCPKAEPCPCLDKDKEPVLTIAPAPSPLIVPSPTHVPSPSTTPSPSPGPKPSPGPGPAPVPVPVPIFMPSPGPVPGPVPGPLPGPAPSPYPAPSPNPYFEPINDGPPAPPPPCNWTMDTEGIARPAKCDEDEYGFMWCNITQSFPENCTKPILQDCMNLPNLGMWPYYFQAHGEGVEHAVVRNITCQEGAVPTSPDLPIHMWDTWQNNLTKEASTVCVNGTWRDMEHINMALLRPINLTCHTTAQIKRLKDMMHWENVTQQAEDDTMQIPFQWIDAGANLRKANLDWAFQNARRLTDEAQNGVPLKRVDEYETVIQAMFDNKIQAHGDPFNDTACAFLEKQWLYEPVPPDGESRPVPLLAPSESEPPQEMIQPAGLKCKFAAEKSFISWDYALLASSYNYRNGCYCESHWTGGCPWKYHYHGINFKTFGFDSMLEKTVTTSMGSSMPNALCWYWSNPLYPEWGFFYYVNNRTQAPIRSHSERMEAHELNIAQAKAAAEGGFLSKITSISHA